MTLVVLSVLSQSLRLLVLFLGVTPLKGLVWWFVSRLISETSLMVFLERLSFLSCRSSQVRKWWNLESYASKANLLCRRTRYGGDQGFHSFAFDVSVDIICLFVQRKDVVHSRVLLWYSAIRDFNNWQWNTITGVVSVGCLLHLFGDRTKSLGEYFWKHSDYSGGYILSRRGCEFVSWLPYW